MSRQQATPHAPWQSLFLRPAHRIDACHCGDRPAAPVKSARWAHRSPSRTAAGQNIPSSHLTGTSHQLAPRPSGPATTILAGQPTATSTSRADPEPSGAPTPLTQVGTSQVRKWMSPGQFSAARGGGQCALPAVTAQDRPRRRPVPAAQSRPPE